LVSVRLLSVEQEERGNEKKRRRRRRRVRLKAGEMMKRMKKKLTDV
jgi:hypothetical protein